MNDYYLHDTKEFTFFNGLCQSFAPIWRLHSWESPIDPGSYEYIMGIEVIGSGRNCPICSFMQQSIQSRIYHSLSFHTANL